MLTINCFAGSVTANVVVRTLRSCFDGYSVDSRLFSCDFFFRNWGLSGRHGCSSTSKNSGPQGLWLLKCFALAWCAQSQLLTPAPPPPTKEKKPKVSLHGANCAKISYVYNLTLVPVSSFRKLDISIDWSISNVGIFKSGSFPEIVNLSVMEYPLPVDNWTLWTPSC